MVKRLLKTNRVRVQIVGLLIEVIILAIAYQRMGQAKSDLTDYELARSCRTQENCRQVIQATILQSGALNLVANGYRSLGFDETLYSVTLSAPVIGKQTVKISPNPPSNIKPFDLQNVYIPTGSDVNFVEENFYPNRVVEIEIWRNQITYLYLNGIHDFPWFVIPATQMPNTQTIITKNDDPHNNTLFALPTTVHPVFQEASAESSFYGLVFVCIFLILMSFIFFPVRLGRTRHGIIGHEQGNRQATFRRKTCKLKSKSVDY
jgi:hypothetical protein